MADYRLYFMTPDGYIQLGLDLDCDDDDQAIAEVEARGEPGPLELWQGGRRLREFPEKPPT